MIVHAAGWLIFAVGLFFLGDRVGENHVGSGPDAPAGILYILAIVAFLVGVVMLVKA